jgi:hypothetical protein
MSHAIMKTVIYNEHTLGLLEGRLLAVLHASVLRGATSTSWIISVDPSETRPATREDFDTYRVKYHPDYPLDY